MGHTCPSVAALIYLLLRLHAHPAAHTRHFSLVSKPLCQASSPDHFPRRAALKSLQFSHSKRLAAGCTGCICHLTQNTKLPPQPPCGSPPPLPLSRPHLSPSQASLCLHQFPLITFHNLPFSSLLYSKRHGHNSACLGDVGLREGLTL